MRATRARRRRRAELGEAGDAAFALRRLADRLEDTQVEIALADGWSWALIAEALGVTRQAVHKKHGKRLKGAR